MHEFMKEHRVPGASIAVTHQGRTVFARGYGSSDIAAKEIVQPTSLFRIASISKPITAIAILQLCEQGKLQLEDPVFSLLGIRLNAEKKNGSDPRLAEITVQHLLQHRGGWDRNLSFDAMFKSISFAQQQGVAPPATQEVVIQAMLKQPLDFSPGERYAYSNFGYCLLGRVIERLSGMSYESFVKQNVLDVYPEYNGTSLTFLGQAPTSDGAAACGRAGACAVPCPRRRRPPCAPRTAA